jgi:hypothetical protein
MLQNKNISTCIDIDSKLWTWANFDFDQDEEQNKVLKSLQLSIHPSQYESTKYKEIKDIAIGLNYMLMISEEQPMLPKPALK